MRKTNDLFTLEGSVAVITGGATGIGRQMASGLGEMGAHIVLCARNAARCAEVAKSLRDEGISAMSMKCDVTRIEELEEVVQKCIAEFDKIDILVNNAGTTWGGPAIDTKPEAWIKVINVNLMGAVNASQVVGREMIKRRKGNIINVASCTGFGGTDPKYQDSIAYNTSKGALITFTKDLAVKWVGHGIRVNALAPGWFPTKMTDWQLGNHGETIRGMIPMNRFGSEYELKGAVVFLASEASSYVTGHILAVDGGYLAW